MAAGPLQEKGSGAHLCQPQKGTAGHKTLADSCGDGAGGKHLADCKLCEHFE